jgi:hypothetical protein
MSQSDINRARAVRVRNILWAGDLALQNGDVHDSRAASAIARQ